VHIAFAAVPDSNEIGRYTYNVSTASQHVPPPLSSATVAYMIRLFDSMYRAPTHLVKPMFDIEQLSITLFAMGFVREFISDCQYKYGWNAKALFMALYDGSFYGYGVRDRSKGQGDLRGFATFLCGAFVQHAQLRTPLNKVFEQSLLNDGYRFDGRALVEVTLDTSVSAEISELPNRESLLSDVSSQLHGGAGVAVLFIDLDHFKKVNDQLSHAHGDKCLIIVVRTISEVLRHKGKLYRVGGDEFCVMLPNFCVDEARATAERIRKSIDALKAIGGLVKVTASLGVAVSDGNKPASADTLIRAADEAMYVSKFTTKNRVCVWPPNPAEAAQAEENRKKAAT
jgi:diguanylate cyclase (GGDEF)-like protein